MNAKVNVHEILFREIMHNIIQQEHKHAHTHTHNANFCKDPHWENNYA